MGKKTGKRYTEAQIIRILDELKAGKTADEICRTYGVAQSTLYRWKNQYGEMDRVQPQDYVPVGVRVINPSQDCRYSTGVR